MKHHSKLPIDTLWSIFTTKFNKDHNLEKPGDAKLPEQLKVFSTKVSDDIFKMFGGDKDYNHKKDMPPIASLVFAMKKERDEKVEQYNFVQKTIKENKEMVRKGKVALASYVLDEGETTNPHIKVPDVCEAQGCPHLQRSTKFMYLLSSIMTTTRVKRMTIQRQIMILIKATAKKKVRLRKWTWMMRDLPVTLMRPVIELFVSQMDMCPLIQITRRKTVCS